MRSWFEDIEHRVTIAFEIFNLTHDRRAARGQVILATVDREGRLLLETPPELHSGDDPERLCEELREIMPASPNIPYDMKKVIESVVDDGDFFE